MTRSLYVAGEKGNGQEIKEAFNVFAEPEFAFAEAALVVGDGNFSNFEFLFGGYNGNVAVELTIETDGFDNIFTVGFEAAVGVVNMDTSEERNQ